MYCTNCGNRLEKDNKFCGSCGKEINASIEKITLQNEQALEKVLRKGETGEKDPMFEKIMEFVIKKQIASASLIQRTYKIGYNRAARIIDVLEENGVIGPSRGEKPREVLIKPENYVFLHNFTNEELNLKPKKTKFKL